MHHYKPLPIRNNVPNLEANQLAHHPHISFYFSFPTTKSEDFKQKFAFWLHIAHFAYC